MYTVYVLLFLVLTHVFATCSYLLRPESSKTLFKQFLEVNLTNLNAYFGSIYFVLFALKITLRVRTMWDHSPLIDICFQFSQNTLRVWNKLFFPFFKSVTLPNLIPLDQLCWASDKICGSRSVSCLLSLKITKKNVNEKAKEVLKT